MIPVTFSILGLAACGFLIYAFAQFHRELLHLRHSPVRVLNLTEVDVRRTEAVLILERLTSHTRGIQRAKNKTVTRKEMLTSAVIGLVGLLAPFIFVMLFKSGNERS